MATDNFVHAYIEAADKASKRSREMLTVIIIVTALIASIFWNARQGGWLARRVAQMEHRVEILQKLNDPSFTMAGYTLEDARLALADLRRRQREQTESVHIPVINTSLDINDVAIFSGAILILLMFLFRRALWQEVQATSHVFRTAESHDSLRPVYELLSPQQTLARAAPLDADEEHGQPWNALRLAAWAPMLVYFSLCVRSGIMLTADVDLTSLETWVYGWLTTIFFFAIIMLTRSLTAMLKSLDAIWLRAAGSAATHVASRNAACGSEVLTSTPPNEY